MHGCDTAIASLQQNVKSAQTILQPASAGTDDSPGASSKYNNWELTAYRVSDPHLGWFDNSPSDDVEIWLLVLTAPCTENQVDSVHFFLFEDVLNLIGQPSHRPPAPSHTTKVRIQCVSNLLMQHHAIYCCDLAV